VVQTDETGLAHGIPSSAIEVGGSPTVVVEAKIVTCLLVECRLGGTSVEHLQYYLQKVLTWPSSSSSPPHPSRFSRYPHGQSQHSLGH
jgi:hypothetical protein